jgi:hypothetical protein
MVIFAAKHGWFAAGRSGEGGRCQVRSQPFAEGADHDHEALKLRIDSAMGRHPASACCCLPRLEVAGAIHHSRRADLHFLNVWALHILRA